MPDLFIWHAKYKRLQLIQQKQEGREKNFCYFSIYRPDAKQFFRTIKSDQVSTLMTEK